MDINEILAQAKRNKKDSHSAKRYNTDVKPAKKLPRPAVNPDAIKAFLEKKKSEEIKNLVKAKKDKEELQKLRDVSKTAKKANSMAKRTKDNLKVYKGEDVLGLYPEPKKRRRGGPPSPTLSPEADRKHKAFMKNIVPKVKVPGVNDDDSDDEYKEPVLEQDERKLRKLEKKKAKARSASNLDFGDLIRMAESQKKKMDDSSSSSSDNDSDSADDSDGSTDKYGRPLSAEEKYQRERRKRRELEERLKMSSTQKYVPAQSKHHRPPSNSLANFKIGKLNSGMSEESKRARIKALMEKFKKSPNEGTVKEKSSNEKESRKNRDPNGGQKIHKSHSTSSLLQLKERKRPEDRTKQNGVKRERSPGSMRDLKHHKDPLPSRDSKTNAKNHQLLSKHKHKLKSSRPSSDSETRQTKIDDHLKMKKHGSPAKERTLPKQKQATERAVPNPYKHTVVKHPPKRPATDAIVDPWAKSSKAAGQNPNKKPRPLPPPIGKCTLRVTSESVKTNYPGVAQEDPYIQAYKKTGKVMPKLTPEMVAQYKAAIMRKLKQENRVPPVNGHRRAPPPKRRYGVIGDDSEEEYDPELEGFIVDEEEVEDDNVDVSSHIKAIFGYDKSKYGRESEWELSKMEASYKDIEKEEKRSLKIAKEEDAREAKLEEERMKRMEKNRRR